MSIFDKIFSRKKKITDVPLEEIRREEKRLEIKESQLLTQTEKLDHEKEEIFRQGARAKSASRRRIYARRFGDIMSRVKLLDRELGRLSKEIMTITRVKWAIERSKSAVSSILQKLTESQITELQRLLEDDKITEDFYVEKLDTILGITSDPAYEVQEISPEGLEVLKVWEAMDEGELEFDDGLKKVEKEAEKPKEATEDMGT